MFSQKVLSLGLVTAGVAIAQDLTISQPTSDHWWVANSDNTVAWSGTSGHPTDFSVFLYNPNPTILTSKLALISVEPYYEMSKTVNPGTMTPGTGYTIQLTDTLNSSNIYASSESFEIKPQGSLYPPQTNAVSNSSASSSSRSSDSPSGSSSSPSATHSGSGVSQMKLMSTSGLIGGLCAFNFLVDMLEGELHRFK